VLLHRAVRGGIASILHRETLAVIVGSKVFQRGERCFADGRVVEVTAHGGELRGTLRPSEAGRRPYTTRIWSHEDGLAYQCSCPLGEQREFCKHFVAIALAHLDAERAAAATGHGLEVLREAMGAVSPGALVDGLMVLAARDPVLADDLKRLCLEALSNQ
jgi:uncharacterized Zn finger protein